MKQTLTKREKVLLYILLCIIIVVGGFFYIIMPAMEKHTDLQAKKDTAEMELISTKASIPDVYKRQDKYMLIMLADVCEKVKKAYGEYRFADVTSMLTNLMTNEFSAYYLDYTKDILYIEKKDSNRRRQVQTVLYLSLIHILLPKC